MQTCVRIMPICVSALALSCALLKPMPVHGADLYLATIHQHTNGSILFEHTQITKDEIARIAAKKMDEYYRPTLRTHAVNNFGSAFVRQGPYIPISETVSYSLSKPKLESRFAVRERPNGQGKRVKLKVDSKFTYLHSDSEYAYSIHPRVEYLALSLNDIVGNTTLATLDGAALKQALMTTAVSKDDKTYQGAKVLAARHLLDDPNLFQAIRNSLDIYLAEQQIDISSHDVDRLALTLRVDTTLGKQSVTKRHDFEILRGRTLLREVQLIETSSDSSSRERALQLFKRCVSSFIGRPVS